MSRHSGKIFGVLIVVLASAAGLFWTFSDSSNSPVSHREAAMRVMAEHLNEKFPGASVLVISNPFAEKSGGPSEIYDFQNAAIAGIRKGFSKDTKIAVAPAALSPAAQSDPRSVPVDPASKTPLSFLMAEDAFDKLLEAHPGTTLVISLIGVPLNLARCKAWNKEGAPHFALLLPDWRMIGDPRGIERAFASGKLAAAVVEQEGVSTTAEVSGNYRELFDRYFILVTRENVGTLLREQPKVFIP